MFQVLFASLVALLVGAAFCLWGYRIFLVLLPVWGFFAGFWLGAHTVTLLLGDGFLATTTGWIVGIVGGVLLALFSYLFYTLGVALIAGVAGYAIGTSLLGAIGITATWLLVGIGLLVALAIVVATFRFNLQKYVIIALTAIGGANSVILGILLLLGRVSPTGVSGSGNAIQPVLADSWFWAIAWLAVAIGAIFYQVRSNSAYRWQKENYVQGWG